MNTTGVKESKIDSKKNPNVVQTEELSGAEAVLKACIAEGVETIFGYPGNKL